MLTDAGARLRRPSPMRAGLTVLSLLMGWLVAGCSRSGEAVVLPTGTQLVAEWNLTGGFMPVGMNAVDAPRLVVYSDGQAVADARRTFRLSPGEVASLIQELRSDLAGLGSTVTPDTDVRVADGPTTELGVLGPHGEMRVVSAYALGILDGFPDRLVAAERVMRDLADRVSHDGTPYRASRVRLVLEPRDRADGAVDAWPATVPVPAPRATGDPVRVADLSGTGAAAVIRDLADAEYDGRGLWPIRRLPEDTLVGVAWRYLLPHE